MPNHVTHRCIITGAADELVRMRELIVVDGEIDCSRVISMPECVKATMGGGDPDNAKARCKAETGFGDSSEWSINHWGTPWGIYHYAEVAFYPTLDTPKWHFTFDTAWGSPMPVIYRLAEMFPELCIDIAAEEDGFTFSWVGQFKGGDHNMWTCEEPASEVIRLLCYGEKYYNEFDADELECNENCDDEDSDAAVTDARQESKEVNV